MFRRGCRSRCVVRVQSRNGSWSDMGGKCATNFTVWRTATSLVASKEQNNWPKRHRQEAVHQNADSLPFSSQSIKQHQENASEAIELFTINATDIRPKTWHQFATVLFNPSGSSQCQWLFSVRKATRGIDSWSFRHLDQHRVSVPNIHFPGLPATGNELCPTHGFFLFL